MNVSTVHALRRISALSLILLFLFTLSACRKDSAETTNPTDTPPAVQTQPSALPETTAPPEPVNATVTVDELNVRSGVGVYHDIVATLVRGDTVQILEQVDLNGVMWGRISEGWICLTYVQQEGEPMHDPDATAPYQISEPITGRVIANELNVRSGPSTNYAVTDTLNKDDTLTISEMNGIWGKTDAGWVNTIFVYFPDSVDAQTITGTVTADKLNVRTGPSTAYDSLYKLENGDKVEILKQVTIRNTRWGYTGDGWVCLDYIEKDQ